MNAETETYKGHEIEIKHDENAENPRNWDNICIIHTAHRKYSFGDKSYSIREKIHDAEKEAIRNGDIVLPLYIYEHSGITISLTPFSCPWDSGQIGFVQVPRKIMIEEFGNKIFTSKLKKRALEIAKEEVKTFDCYISGEVYGYVVDEINSCWGYYSIKDALEEAKGIVDWIIKDNIKKHCEQVKIWIKNHVPLNVRKSLLTI